MQYADVINQLRDIHVPEPIGWFPLPAAWWWLSGAIILILILCVVSIQRYRTRRQRTALGKIRKLISAHQNGLSDHETAENLAFIIREFAFAQFPKNDLRGLYGEEWLQFLDRTGGEGKFGAGVGRNILVWPYRKIDHGDLNGLIEITEQWLQSNSYRRRKKVALP